MEILGHIKSALISHKTGFSAGLEADCVLIAGISDVHFYYKYTYRKGIICRYFDLSLISIIDSSVICGDQSLQHWLI